MSHASEFLIQCRDFYQTSEVTSSPDRDCNMGNFYAKNFVVVLVDTDSLDRIIFFPFFEGDDQVDVLFGSDGAGSEDGGDVDDADSANFHVEAGDF